MPMLMSPMTRASHAGTTSSSRRRVLLRNLRFLLVSAMVACLVRASADPAAALSTAAAAGSASFAIHPTTGVGAALTPTAAAVHADVDADSASGERMNSSLPLPLPAPRSLAIPSCPASCSGVGVCNADLVCQCPQGALGVGCGIQSTPTLPVYAYAFTGLGGQRIQQTWRVDTSAASPTLQLRWCHSTGNWFGGIFDVDYDGMTPASGTTGDTWTVWLDDSTTPAVTHADDWTSTGRSSPDADPQQDLHLVSSWSDSASGLACIEFTRLLNTGDPTDVVISDLPGQDLRFMWTYGLGGNGGGHGGHGGSSSSTAKLSMHGYLSETGQFRIDFAGGIMTPLNDGVEWPVGYLYGVVLTLGCLLLPFGLLTQRDSVKQSAFGRCLRQRPLVRLCGAGAKRSRDANSLLHVCTGQAWPILRTMSLQEITIWLVYLGINVAIAVTSFQEYDDNGRGRVYVLGHLLSLHLALVLLPVSRNSFFLSILNIGFDLALTWHRRIGKATLIFFFLHLISMAVVWDAAVIFSLSTCSWGMGPLYGTIAFLLMLVLVGTSIEWVRRHHWEWFLFAHIPLACGIYALGMLHSVNLRYLVIGPGAILLVDVALRAWYRPFVMHGGKIAGVAAEENQQAQAAPMGKPSAAGGVRVAAAAGGGVPRYDGAASVVPAHPPSAAAGCLVSSNCRLVGVECYGQVDASAYHSRVVVLTVRIDTKKPTSNFSLFPSAASAPAPGSHYQVIVPELTHLESHPFTVSQIRTVDRGDTRQVFLSFHILVVESEPTRAVISSRVIQAKGESTAGTWTQRLFALAERTLQPDHTQATFDGWDYNGHGNGEVPELGDSISLARASSRLTSPAVPVAPFTLLLDGPYHSLNLPLHRSPILVLVGGGIGVTPLTAFLSWYMDAHDQRQAALALGGSDAELARQLPPLPQRIHLVWTARTASAFIHWFPHLLWRIRDHHTARIHVQLYLTTSTDVGVAPARGGTRAAVRPKAYQPASNGSTLAPPKPTQEKARNPSESNPLVTIQVQQVQVAAGSSEPARPPVGVELAASALAEGDAAASPPPVVAAPSVRAAFVETERAAERELAMHDVDVNSSPSSRVGGPPAAAAFPLEYGRPSFSLFFDSLAEELAKVNSKEGEATPPDAAPRGRPLTLHDVTVFSCGPDALTADVEFEAEKRGCAFTHEAFEY